MNAVRVFPRKASAFLAAACLMAGLAFTAATVTPASAKDAKKVTAKYDIGFNGFSIGRFTLWSSLDDREYQLKAKARISVLAGILFEWRGNTSSSGRVYAQRPRPYSFNFGYQTSSKSETINLEFSNNYVKDVSVSPPQRESSKRVPVSRKHMRNVVDPLSAIVMLTNIGSRKSGREVCTRRLPIFDGKARYDLKLSYKGTKTVSTAHGYRGPAYICKIKFRPIAGHKRGDDEARFAAANDRMEIWMVPLKEADLYVPYYIYLPTQVGTASLTASQFDVKNGGSRGALLQ